MIWMMHPPVVGPSARESFSFVLGASAVFDRVSVAFVGEGVWYLAPHNKTDLPNARFAPSIALLQAYDIGPCYVEKDALIAHGFTLENISFPVKSVERSELDEQAHKSNIIITL